MFSDIGRLDNLKYVIDPSIENKGQEIPAAECALGMNSGHMISSVEVRDLCQRGG